MVKVRDSLPLINGDTTTEDSASLAAQLVAQSRYGYRYPTRPDNNKLSYDLKQRLTTNTLVTRMNQSLSAPNKSANSTLNNPYCKDMLWPTFKFIDYKVPRPPFINSFDHHTNCHNFVQRSHLINSLQIDTSEHIGTVLQSAGDANTHSKEAVLDLPAWLEVVCKRINVDSLDNLVRACELINAHLAMCDNNRSGAFMTGIGMTDILTYLYQDEDALIAAMLYRAARIKLISIDKIRDNFGNDIATLVEDTLAMGRLSETIEKNKRLEDHFSNNQREQLLNVYSMLISVTNDVRVVLIKLAERTFAMRELSFADSERQQRVAREVMTIYAPLAHRLGIAQIKWELEDLAFRYLAPDRYKEIAKLLAEKRSEREAYIERMEQELIKALSAANIKAEVSGRVKHIYSIYRKMKLKGLSFDQLYDIRALRVLVPSKAECYHTLGIVHSLWRHIPEQFDDYITNPKSNGYRSLHTAVIAQSKSLEIQIRTHQMHFEAELGMCAHVNYKEGGKHKNDSYLNQKISSLRQLLLNGSDKKLSTKTLTHPDIDPTDELDEDEQLVDFSELERIYIFSRDGDIAELPKGSTVLDFAYYVHTQVGNRAQAARVNQRYVPLTYQLKTGEQVEIITKSSREPNRDWLVPSLGYIHTTRARSKLRQWFNKQDREKNIDIGKQMLSKELGRLAVHPNSINLNDYLQHFNTNNSDDILVGLVTGEIGLNQLTNHILREHDLTPKTEEQDFSPSVHPKATGKLDAYKINIDGLDNIEIRIANCCQPIYGEPIAGFITQSKGVSIHNRGCAEYARLIENEPARQISATWFAQKSNFQPVDVHIEAYDRRGLLRDLTHIIDVENVNIRGVSTHSDEDNIAHITFNLEVTGLAQLSKLLAKLEQQPGILHARRVV